MHAQLSDKISKRKDRLGAQLKFKMLAIALDCAKFWEYPEEIDQYLIQAINRIPQSKLFYVIDFQGLQLSSNIFSDGSSKRHARGQDLSKRPYTHNIHSEKGFSLSPVYLSSIDRKPSITATHPVFHENGNLVGFIVADFDIDDFPDDEINICEEQSWRQIKGDPAIRKNLFNKSVSSALWTSIWIKCMTSSRTLYVSAVFFTQNYTMAVQERRFGPMSDPMNTSYMY